MSSPFLELSRALLDDDTLPERDAQDLFDLLAPLHGDALTAVLDAWRARPADRSPGDWLERTIWPDPALRPTCIDVAATWLFGAPFKAGAIVATEASTADMRAAAHFKGRFWGLARAHPPGLSGGYFGHWAYEAER